MSSSDVTPESLSSAWWIARARSMANTLVTAAVITATNAVPRSIRSSASTWPVVPVGVGLP